MNLTPIEATGKKPQRGDDHLPTKQHRMQLLSGFAVWEVREHAIAAATVHHLVYRRAWKMHPDPRMQQHNRQNRKPRSTSTAIKTRRRCLLLSVPHRGRSYRLSRPRNAEFYSVFFLFRALILNQIGLPINPKFSLIWFAKNRSKLKCIFTSLSVNSTNVGGATAACVM
jgi:hypothetical protein